jgi:hypothetical protein
MPPEAETTSLVTPPTETPEDKSLIGNPPADPPKTPEEEAPPETPEAKAEREATEAAETARLAPITVEDLVLPEGFTTTDELKTEFVETINKLADLGPKERAEALLNLQAKALTAASEASSAAWSTMQDQWRDEVKADLGDKLQPTLDSINRLVKEFGTPQLTEALALTGAGNNLQVIKFLGAVAEKMTEGGYSAGAPSGAETTAAQRMYPSMKG